MQVYTNKSDRTNSAKCLYSEIKSSRKARKTAARRTAKNEIRLLINNRFKK